MSRPDLIESSVSFLRDPSVGDSPMASRVAFLESKGLTSAEIDESFRIAYAGGPTSSPTSGNVNTTGGTLTTTQPGAGLPPSAMTQRQLPQRPYGYGGNNIYDQRAPPGQVFDERGRDWRDWFIMSVIGGSVGYALYALARKYVLPALSPPTETELQSSEAALTAKYDEAAAILASLQSDTKAIREDLDAQKESVNASLEEVRSVVENEKEAVTKRNEELDHVREEIDSIKKMLPQMIEKGKEAQTNSLNELQNELKSLKSLLLSNRPQQQPQSEPSVNGTKSPPQATSIPTSTSPSSDWPTSGNSLVPDTSSVTATSSSSATPTSKPSSPFPFNRTPSLPAWQLQAAAKNNENPDNATTSSTTPNDNPNTDNNNVSQEGESKSSSEGVSSNQVDTSTKISSIDDVSIES